MQSMTGYGMEYGFVSGRKIVCIIKSYNSRFFEMFLDIPYEFSHVEPRIKMEIKKRVKRGKIEVIVRKEPEPRLKFFHLFSKKTSKGGEEEFFYIFLSCLQKFIDSRAEEGQRIKDDIKERLERLKELTAEVEQLHKRFPQYVKSVLKERVNQIAEEIGIGEIPDNIIDLAGVVHIVRKSDISEEITRIKSHLASFEEELQREGDGKKLLFISQEILREINTLGSKSTDINIIEKVIDMKLEIERIREQLYNVE